LKLKLVNLLFLLFVSSCKYFNSEDAGNRISVARVYDHYLFEEDLVGVVPAGSSRDDSISITKNFIENWIRKKAVLYKAEKNLSDEKKDVSGQLEEYRNSLITYAYERELINQKLDTNITEEEILQFYKSQSRNFELKDNIIKVIYLKLNKKSPKLDKVRVLYKSNSEKDRAALEEYCHQYAINYYLDDNTWLLFDDLLKEIPIKTYDKEQFLRNNRFVEIEDSSLIYLVNIKGFMIKNSISPLSFERNNIISMIMNDRKFKLLEEMERDAIDDASRQGEIQNSM
jgi:hypothetical protein